MSARAVAGVGAVRHRESVLLFQARQVAALLALLLVGCGDQRVKEAQELVRATLSDPGSAQFSDIVVSHKNPQVVCGVVNSKNKFGGYAGPKRFYADLREKRTQVDTEQTLTPEARGMFGGIGVVDAVEFERLYQMHC